MKPARKLLLSLSFLLLAAAIGFYLRPISFYNGYAHARLLVAGGRSRYVVLAVPTPGAPQPVRIHYNVIGPDHGQPIVLVHGLGGHAEDWQGIYPSLTRAGYRVYMIDLVGFGHSDHPIEFSYSPADQATMLLSFFDALNLRQPDLVGWSMGGWVAQLVAIQHPDHINKLILIDSAGLGIVNGAPALPTWDTNLFTPTDIPQFHALTALLTPHPPSVPAFFARDFIRTTQQNSWVIHRALASMLTGHDTTDFHLSALHMPVLIVWGTADQIFPISHAEELNRLIPQSQLDLFNDCGHLTPINCSTKVAPSLITFLQQ